MKENNMNNIFYHYTSATLQRGDVIRSNQSNGKTYDLIWRIYQEVAKSLGYSFPQKYGYAYGELKSRQSNTKCYRVTSDKVIRGNFQYSLYTTMDCLGQLVDKKLQLQERLKSRDEAIRQRAVLYFKAEDNIEYISESFVVDIFQ